MNIGTAVGIVVAIGIVALVFITNCHDLGMLGVWCK